MEVILAVICLAVLGWLLLRRRKPEGRRYDRRGFDHNGIHRNGTKYDDEGYDVQGYDPSGFDRSGYDRRGKNARGQYDRLHDTHLSEDGLSSPAAHPIVVTTHARQRIAERLPAKLSGNAESLARDAYRYGRSKRQIKKTSAALIEEIEARYENSVVLIYRGYIYIFSEDNKLITVYKNDRIPL